MHCMTETRCHCRKSEGRGVVGAVHCLGSKNVSSSSHHCSMGRDGVAHAHMPSENQAILAAVMCAHPPLFHLGTQCLNQLLVTQGVPSVAATLNSKGAACGSEIRGQLYLVNAKSVTSTDKKKNASKMVLLNVELSSIEFCLNVTSGEQIKIL